MQRSGPGRSAPRAFGEKDLKGEYRLGVDIGGTFTDLVLLGKDGSVQTLKIPSTPGDYSEAIVEGAKKLLDRAGVAPDALSEIVHATTVVTNTVLEQKGARTALVTTRGFRDVLGMRRLRIPEMYNLQYRKPAPLAPRRLTFEVSERMGPDGSVWLPLDLAEVRKVAEQLVAAEVEAVAISLLHAYANDRHERAIAEIIGDALGREIPIVLSSRILPEIREYERTSTTVVSAYVAPMVTRYLSILGNRLREAGIEVPLRIVQSNGGAMTRESAIANPAHLLESGPAAGVIACARTVAMTGIQDAISLDMGGTTAKAAMIENGVPVRTLEYEVGAGINLSSQLVKGGGYSVKLPFIDVSEIGAGGGSIVTLGAEGTIRVGPQSAGANPGPACYGRGSDEPTFTDAMVVLGYLNSASIAGGEVEIRAELARKAIEERVARPLHLEVEEAAYGIYTLAGAAMTRAVKAVTTFRGRDPRDFTLFAFGGNGPVAASAIAAELGIRDIMVPPAPGVFSAFGLPLSEVEHELTRSVMRSCTGENAGAFREVFERLKSQARAALAKDGIAENDMLLTPLADMRFTGQAFELTIVLPDGEVDVNRLREAFSAEHRRTFGHGSAADGMTVVNLKVLARGLGKAPSRFRWPDDIRIPVGTTRRAYFGPTYGMMETPVVSRNMLEESPRAGPLIVEEYDATCVVPPNAKVRRDPIGNIAIEMIYEDRRTN